MIQCQAKSGASAPVMTGYGETVEAEMPHQGYAIGSLCAL